MTDVVRQNDKLFNNLFNEVQVSDDGDVEKLLKTRIARASDEKYPKDALQIYAENEAARKKDEAVLIDLPSEFYAIEADEKITNNSKHPLVITQACQKAENKQILDFFPGSYSSSFSKVS